MNANVVVSFTADGLAELQGELKDLRDVKLPATVDRVARARDFGDLAENAEYHAAKEELAFVEGRIEELEELVQKASVVPKTTHNGHVDIGCKVTVVASGKEHTYEIVGEWEADPLLKKISHTSPLGQALLGRKKGESVEFVAPAGKIIYKIKSIR